MIKKGIIWLILLGLLFILMGFIDDSKSLQEFGYNMIVIGVSN